MLSMLPANKFPKQLNLKKLSTKANNNIYGLCLYGCYSIQDIQFIVCLILQNSHLLISN